MARDIAKPETGSLAGILALAAALQQLQGGAAGLSAAGGSAPRAAGTSVTPSRSQPLTRIGQEGDSTFDQLFPELERMLETDRTLTLRRALLADPELQYLLPADTLGGLPLGALATGGVPLQRAVLNLAFGLLPRYARTSTLNAGPTNQPFAGTSEQQALLEAGPRTRIGRSGV